MLLPEFWGELTHTTPVSSWSSLSASRPPARDQEGITLWVNTGLSFLPHLIQNQPLPRHVPAQDNEVMPREWWTARFQTVCLSDYVPSSVAPGFRINTFLKSYTTRCGSSRSWGKRHCLSQNRVPKHITCHTHQCAKTLLPSASGGSRSLGQPVPSDQSSPATSSPSELSPDLPFPRVSWCEQSRGALPPRASRTTKVNEGG